MTTAVIIASAHHDLLRLATGSINRFAPEADVIAIDNGSGVGAKNPRAGCGADDHASAIHFARSFLPPKYDHVVVFDDDALVTSERWLPTLQSYHRTGYGVVGGVRHRGLPDQIAVDGVLVPHAHCLSFTRGLFDLVPTFYSEKEPGLRYLRYDTGVHACLFLHGQCCEMKVLPHYPVGTGPLFRALAVGEYYDPVNGPETLWVHLGRGTSFAPDHPVREWIRQVTALWSPRSQKILRRQNLRAAYLARGRDLVGLR